MKFLSLLTVLFAIALGSPACSVLAGDPVAGPAPGASTATPPPAGAGIWKTIWIKRGYVGNFEDKWAGGPGILYRKPVPLPVNGTAVRVWTKALTSQDITLKSASIYKGTGQSMDGVILGNATSITFARQPTLLILQKTNEVASDEIPVAISPGVWYLQEGYGGPLCGYAYDADGCFSVPAETPDVANPGRTIKGSYVGNIFRVDVLTTDKQPVVLCYGDSITQGAGSSPLSGKRYPSILSGLLGQPVLNLGQNGDLVLFTGGVPSMVNKLDGVESVVLLMGINDIITSQKKLTSADDYARLVGNVAKGIRSSGKKFYIGTITPSGGFAKFDEDPNKEVLRQAINTWIRSQKSTDVDGMIDFDEALRDPANPTKMREEYSSGDWLHPGDKGYEKMAETAAKVLKK